MTIFWSVVLGWVLASVLLVLASAGSIAGLRFPDADDAMRLLEVRDWLAGQSWWDVAQHRFDYGHFPMHWSRLVDLPLGALLCLTTPLFGAAVATRVTMVVVPLVTLLAIMALAAAITRRLGGGAAARHAVLLVPLSVPIVAQARPLRIDHHGWQVVLALAATSLLLGRPTARRGAIAGLALAVLLTISLEGLPMAAALLGIAGLAAALQPARHAFTMTLGWSAFGGAVLLQIATRGAAALAPACDAMAPSWLAMLGVAALGLSAAGFAPTVRLRLTALVATGMAAGATPLLLDPACMVGPFATLPPLAYHLWYLNVSEGRPIWEQAPDWALMTVGLPIAGLIGTIRACRDAEGEAHTRWAILLALLGAAFALSLLVNRAGATANALAVPGAATLLLALLTRSRAIAAPGKRTLATLGALLIASPGQAAAIALIAGSAFLPTAKSAGPVRASCDSVADLRAIGRLPAGTVFAPIDAAPDLVATTHHGAIAGGYHRGAQAIERVMRGFTAEPDAARRIVLASGANYVAGCPGLNETTLYARDYPRGLWARLERGERFPWLAPIATGNAALAWRVVRPLPPATPRP